MKKWLLLYACLLPLLLLAQEVPATTEQQLENLEEENPEDDALLQQLAHHRRHPLNLNTASAENLQALRFLTDLQIANLLRYRRLLGKLLDLYELQAVPTFDLLTIQKIRPFVYVGPALQLKEELASRLKGGEQYVLLRYSRLLEKAKGYDQTLMNHYAGDPSRLQLRYRYQYKNSLYIGLLGDKDAGEPFLKEPARAGFEFYSIHAFVRNLGKIKALALGDYTVNLGQGLTQWQSLAFGKSVEVMNTKRQLPVLMPYRSAGEFHFNRGAAITIGLGRWELTGFFSAKKFSGNLAYDSVPHFTSFQTSGYYRTKSEIADRYQLTDLSGGGNISFRTDNLKLGLSSVLHRFSLPMKKSDEPYNHFAFAGRRLLNSGFDYSFTHRNLHVFGELAVDGNLHKAFVNGLLLSLDKRVDASLFYRNISAGYQSPFGNTFTESNLPGNENGIYAGIAFRPKPGWQLSAYADFYRFPFLKYRVSAPGRGWDYLAQLTFTPSKEGEIYLRFRSKNKPVDETASGMVLGFPSDRPRQNLRLHFASRVHPMFTLKARTETVWLKAAGAGAEHGFLCFLELASQAIGKWRSNLRVQYFETDSYDSRIYAYESDVLYSFSVPAFYDKGFRYYLNLGYEPVKQLQCWARLSQTVYRDKTTTGSGLDEVSGNRRTELRLQVRYIFH